MDDVVDNVVRRDSADACKNVAQKQFRYITYLLREISRESKLISSNGHGDQLRSIIFAIYRLVRIYFPYR